MNHTNGLSPVLLRSVEQGRCVVFLGAGASQACGLHSGPGIASVLAEELRIDWERDEKFKGRLEELNQVQNDLPRVSQLYEGYYKERRAHNKVAEIIAAQERVAKITVLSPLKTLLPIKEILTTNYDCLVETVLDPTDCSVIYKDSDVSASSTKKLTLIKIHGTRTDPESMVLTKQDYDDYSKTHEVLLELTRTLLRTRTLIVVGYSMEDQNFGEIMSRVGTADTKRFFVSPNASLMQELHWTRDRGFEHVPLDAATFFARLEQEYNQQHYTEHTASFPDPGKLPAPIEPLNNPFILFDTEALIEEKPQFLVETFVKPVEFPMLLGHQHTIIEGHRGSGKSTVLWRLSLRARAFDKRVDLPMWGFYVKMVPGHYTGFRRRKSKDGSHAEAADEWLRFFMHYFNLILLDGILMNVEDAFKWKIFKASKGFSKSISEIAELLRAENVKKIRDIKGLRRLVQNRIDGMANDRTKSDFYTGPTFITRVFERLVDFIPELAAKWWHILLDEYDNLYPEHQSIVNILLRERHPKLRYKIAVKTLHAYLLDPDGRVLEPTDDFGYLSCDAFIWDRDMKSKYIKFLEQISNVRLETAKQSCKIRELLPEPEPKPGPKHDYIDYAGFENYCSLSSGLTRQFLELCKDAVYTAFPETAYTRVELSPVSVRDQNHVAKVHSAILFKSYKSTREPQRVLRLFSVLGPLFRGIAKSTSGDTEKSPLAFEIVDLDQLTNESLAVIEESIRCRLLQFLVIPKKPHNPLKEGPAQRYSFHRLLTPIFGLSPSLRFTVPIRAALMNEIWTRPREVLNELAKGYKEKGIEDYLDYLPPLFREHEKDV